MERDRERRGTQSECDVLTPMLLHPRRDSPTNARIRNEFDNCLNTKLSLLSACYVRVIGMGGKARDIRSRRHKQPTHVKQPQKLTYAYSLLALTSFRGLLIVY